MTQKDIDERLAPLVQFMEEGIPFNRALGLRIDRLRRGACVMRVPWNDRFIGDPFRPAVHGGVISALIDTAGGAACFSMLERPEDRVSTVDLRVDYLAPGPSADLVCEARVVRMGNRVAVARMELWGGDLPRPGSEARAHPVATGQGVYNVVRRGEA